MQRGEGVDPDHPGRVVLDVADPDHGGEQVDLVPAVRQRRPRSSGVGRGRRRSTLTAGCARSAVQIGVVAAAGEVVDDGHRVALGDKPAGQVQADEAGAAEQRGTFMPRTSAPARSRGRRSATPAAVHGALSSRIRQES